MCRDSARRSRDGQKFPPTLWRRMIKSDFVCVCVCVCVVGGWAGVWLVEELECHLSCTLITVTLEPNGNSSCSFKFNHCLKRVILQGADLLQPAFTELPSFTFTVIQRMGNHQVSDVIRYRVCKCVCVCAYCWPINLVSNLNLTSSQVSHNFTSF